MSRRPAPHRSQRGATLIELMVALVLGLIVSGAALSLFIANRQTYLATESLGRLQDNGATAFELMARDVREAAGNPCDASDDVVNVLKTPTAAWYTDFGDGIRGYGGTQAMSGLAIGTAAGQRVSGTDAIELKLAADGVNIVNHVPASATFTVNVKSHDLHPGDIAMACDFNHAAIFQVTNAQPGINTTIVHNTGGSTSPGNCSKGLGSPLLCTTTGTSYEFGCKFGGQDPLIDCTLADNRWTATIAKVHATRWYVGHNARGGTSLYQSVVRNNAGSLVVDNDEVAENVSGMTLQYLVRDAGSYVAAASVTDWSKVVAVKVQLAMSVDMTLGTHGTPLRRTIAHVVALRSRAQ
ncbi:prepilin-type N-terminal cleavage/methylation domain-containing protein [Cognatiluteimonas telluris]|uniref:prepilin-type N-terminal cleavage/methylation domain-containing protein n=1 Tax=Cognatiluteimonas telluris TaxID=1104775 RepID=UPI001FAF1129|nr:prepilin-type N-terminal cleavage/methylation domain-containing protein [Lysobacter telluris]